MSNKKTTLSQETINLLTNEKKMVSLLKSFKSEIHES